MARRSSHLRVVALDGTYVAAPDGLPAFRPLGRLKMDEAADVLQLAKVRMLKALERRVMVRLTPEALDVDDALVARDARPGARPRKHRALSPPPEPPVLSQRSLASLFL